MALRQRIGTALIASVLLLPALAIAQSGDGGPPAGEQAATDQNTQDPPSRVGRLSYVEGQVSQFGEGSTDWVEAQLNFPVTSNTAFATGSNGRAEFELGAATARIDFGTELDVIALDEQDTDLRLPQGGMAIDLPNQPADETPASTIVTTPRGDVTLAVPGHYFIAAGTADQPTTVTVLDGSAQITDAANATFNVAAGQSGALTGDSNAPSFAIQAVPMGAFATWVKQREAVYTQAAPPPPQVPRQITGIAQLGAYGGWESEPQYGAVWVPRSLPADWQPYRQGHWAYIRPWGWTWIDSMPWGFAPFHYGRWIRFHDRWAWTPGTAPQSGIKVIVRPVYAPALVAFASGGAAAGAGGPVVAWYPLGWNEPYIPPYRVSRTYIEHVNIRVVERPRLVEVTNVYNRIYARGGNFDPYRQFHVGLYRDHAVAVPRTAFESARPVARLAVKTDVRALRPAIRPVAVTPPAARPRPKLATAEPPKPKILPAAKRAPIPQKLLAPRPRPTVRPAAAPATAAPGRPAAIHPAGKPGTAEPNRPATARPEAKPEAKPGATEPNRPARARPEARPGARPEVKPGAVEPRHPAMARPETKPGEAQRNHPANARPEAKPEAKPGAPERNSRPAARPEARPEHRPGGTMPARRPESRRETKPDAHPAAARPSQHPEDRNAERGNPAEPRHPATEHPAAKQHVHKRGGAATHEKERKLENNQQH